jgi:hypothetical protein
MTNQMTALTIAQLYTITNELIQSELKNSEIVSMLSNITGLDIEVLEDQLNDCGTIALADPKLVDLAESYIDLVCMINETYY